jgi:hypothetical protein
MDVSDMYRFIEEGSTAEMVNILQYAEDVMYGTEGGANPVKVLNVINKRVTEVDPEHTPYATLRDVEPSVAIPALQR